MKDFKTWLKDVKKDKSNFDDKNDQEKLELQNEYNAYLKKEFANAVEKSATKEDLKVIADAMSKAQEETMKTLSNLSLTIKAMKEKGGVDPEEMERSELIALIEKHAGAFDSRGMSKSGQPISGSAKIDATQLLKEVNKAAALMTTANITPVGAGGVGVWSPLFGNYIDNNIYSAPKPSTRIMEFIQVTHQPGVENIYWTERVNEEGNAQWIAEGATKPLADAEWKTSSIETKELAVRWKITTRLLFHARAAVEDFRSHALELMNNELPKGFLLGDGLGNNPKGIISYASAWVGAGDLAATVKCPNVYDAILAGGTTISIAGHTGQKVAFISPADSYAMKTLKDGNSNYLTIPFAKPDGSGVDEITVVVDSLIPKGKLLVGVLYNYKGVISEEAVYAEGFENDDFSKNLMSRKLETFANGYLPSLLSTSIIYDDIATILSDIDNGEPCCCGDTVVTP